MNAIRTFLLGIGMFLQVISGPVKRYFDDKRIAKAQEKATRNALFPADSFLRDFGTKADTDNRTDTK